MPNKKAVKKPAKNAVVKKNTAKNPAAYSCRVCGSYAVIDPYCGCGEEHILICCGQSMKKGVTKKKPVAKKPTAKKVVKKKTAKK